MRIVHVATTVPTGPADPRPSFVLDLALELSRLGHEVQLLAPHVPGAPVESWLDNVHIRRFRYWWPPRQRLFGVGGVMAGLRSRRANLFQVPSAMAAQFLQLRRIVTTVDLVHAHWVVPSGLNAVLACRGTDTPVVVSAHGSDVHALSFANGVKRWTLQRADAITANSLAVAADIQRIYPLASVRHVPIGVALPPASDQRVDEIRTQYGTPLVAFVGRLSKEKGPDVLAAAMAYLPDWSAVFVGEGPMRHVLHGMALVGWQPKHEVAAFIAAADVVAVPSRREGQGLVALEAQALGTAVVASNVGGLPEIVDSLVPPDNPIALAEGILTARRARGTREVPSMRDTARAMTWIYRQVTGFDL